MKKIAIDLRVLESPTGKRGVGYFNRYLFKSLFAKPHPKFKFSLFTFPKSNLQTEFKIGPNDKFQKVPALYWPKRGLRRLDPLFSLFWSHALNTTRPDLLHIPFLFEVYYLFVPDNIKTVITLYDIIPVLFPNEYFQNKRAEDWYRMRLEQAKRASKIITISKSSKKDIERVLGIPSEKIVVIYGGVDESFRPINKQKASLILTQKYKIKSPYILTVSTHSFHKNILRIFQAFRGYITSAKNENLTLVVVCKLIAQEEKDWRKQLKDLGIENRVILTNFISDEDLPNFYSSAEVLLFPSLYEGFGLPVLEAFACRCPVITSNNSSLPEVGGGAVLYVNPLDSEDIRKTIAKLLNDRELRDDLIRKGFAQVKKFSWDKAAKQTLKVYEEVLSSL